MAKSKAIGWDKAFNECVKNAKKAHPNWSQARIERYCAGGLRKTGEAKYGKKGFKKKMIAGRRKASRKRKRGKK